MLQPPYASRFALLAAAAIAIAPLGCGSSSGSDDDTSDAAPTADPPRDAAIADARAHDPRDASGDSFADASADARPDASGDANADAGAVADASVDAAADANVEASTIGTCDGPPPAEAIVKAGSYGSTRILPGGRALTPAGKETIVGGFPVDVRVDYQGLYAYVANTGYADDHRSLQVIDLAAGKVIQEIVRKEAFYGLALTIDSRRLYAAGGSASVVEAYDVGTNGKLTLAGSVAVDGYPAGMAVSQDRRRLWVGKFKGNAIAEVDTTTMTVTSTTSLLFSAYSVLDVPEHGELYVSGFGDTRVAVINYALPIPIVVANVTVGGNPVGLAKSPNGDRVYAASTNDDVIVAIDTASHQVVASRAVGETTIAGPSGPLPASSPSGITIDALGKTLYVARSADNAIALFDAAHLTPLGAIPVGWYPMAVALGSGDATLVATNGKGVGTGPLLNSQNEAGKRAMRGSISIVPLANLDLGASTKSVEDNVRRPDRVYPFTCGVPFPIPTHAGEKSPIEHVVLIVRENKTYDALLGDLPFGERDPSLTLFGDKITPNVHALAREFVNHDNFYDDSETSVQGHEWLTGNFCNDYIERTWFEDYRGHPGFDKDAAFPQGRPSWQSFFAHLMRHQVDFRMYGEIVGALDLVNGLNVLATHGDPAFPGGPYFNLDTKDADKADYVATQIVDQKKFPPFVYVLLPNDHTQGTTPGKPTPESMIADNDLGTGIIIDRISHSPWWASTAIFVVEDDPQVGSDHVDYHRSILLVASPWAKRGYVSSVHASYPSIFRTIEAILQVPPMNRYDALATPLWDAFAKTPDLTPYDLRARGVPEVNNLQTAPLASISELMDFSGPDRNPDLGDLLYWVERGAPPAGARIGRMSHDELRALYAREAQAKPLDDDD
jgi:DNA-binding beta-propeller fold protein YncE